LFVVSVIKTKGQNKDSLLRRFTRLVNDEGYIDLLKNKTTYKPPSEIKKEKTKELQKRKRRNRD